LHFTILAVRMTGNASSPTVLTPREITLHLLGLVLFLGLLGLWYWLSTGARAVPTWIEMLQDDDPSTRIVAAEQLGQVGPAAKAALPQLLAQATRDGSQHANTTAATALKSIDLTAARQVMTHFIPRLQDQDAQQRRTACAVLGSLGPVAKPAVPALLAVAHDPDATRAAQCADGPGEHRHSISTDRGCLAGRPPRFFSTGPPDRRRPNSPLRFP
jgi:hypothetical protein